MYDREEATWHPFAATNYFFLKKYINLLAIPYKSSCSRGIFVIFIVHPCTILSSCLPLQSVTNFLCRNDRSSLTPFFMVLTPLPFQCFDKYYSDYSTNGKTCQTSAQFFARKHFSLVSRADSYSFIKQQFGENVENEGSVNCCLATTVVNRNNRATSNL